MKNYFDELNFKTKGRFDFIDLTKDIKLYLEKSNVQNGFVNIHCPHTSSALTLGKFEPRIIECIKKSLEKIAPANESYNHDDLARRENIPSDEPKNAHSHLKAIHLPTSITVNCINNSLQLGSNQRIIFIELDESRSRKVQVQITGD